MGARGDEQVAVVIRKLVQEHRVERPAEDDEVSPVVRLGEAPANETLVGGFGRRVFGDIRESPRGPKVVHGWFSVAATGPVAVARIHNRAGCGYDRRVSDLPPVPRPGARPPGGPSGALRPPRSP